MAKALSWQGLLDDGLDELAASAHAGFPLRLAVNLASAAVFSLVLPWGFCAAWGAVTLGLELQAWFATRGQFKGRTVGWRTRLWHVSGLALSAAAWVGMGAALWASGSLAGAICAILVWLAVINFAQTNAYQSATGFVVSGAVPAVAVIGVVLFAPHARELQLLPVAATLVLALGMSLDGVSRMLKARKRLDEAQAKMRESERLYRVLADNATDVISLADTNGARVYMSPSVVASLGYPMDVVWRMPVYDFIHPDDRDVLESRISDLMADGEPTTAQYRVIRADGEARWVETNFTLTGDPAGAEPQQILSVARDIQVRKELEGELIEAREAAEAAAAAKSDFLANMTHELRTPLNAIIGFSSVLRDSPNLKGQDARQMRLIGEASATLLDLVNSVLDFSRLEAGAVELDPAPFDPADEAGAIIELMADQAQAKGLELNLVARGAGLVSGDAKRLRQVLLNFLSNAIKFTARGVIELRVLQTPIDADAVLLRVEVADSGVGLTSDQIEHVFERFTQADVSVSRRFGGTGLGLAICKRVIDLMGGTIGADSVEGEGSTFWFEVTLPRAGALSEAPAGAAPELERPIRLLLVEDVAINRELVRAILRPFDIVIETAEDGVAAVEAFRDSVFDLVLMDVQMPVMDGLTATRRIRALPLPTAATTPIIAMTANVLPDQIAKCRQAGMDGHLGKPMQPARLVEAISYWTSRQRLAGREPQLAGRA